MKRKSVVINERKIHLQRDHRLSLQPGVLSLPSIRHNSVGTRVPDTEFRSDRLVLLLWRSDDGQDLNWISRPVKSVVVQ